MLQRNIKNFEHGQALFGASMRIDQRKLERATRAVRRIGRTRAMRQEAWLDSVRNVDVNHSGEFGAGDEAVRLIGRTRAARLGALLVLNRSGYAGGAE